MYIDDVKLNVIYIIFFFLYLKVVVIRGRMFCFFNGYFEFLLKNDKLMEFNFIISIIFD